MANIGRLLSMLLANASETLLLMLISVILGACFVVAFYELEQLRVRWRHPGRANPSLQDAAAVRRKSPNKTLRRDVW